MNVRPTFDVNEAAKMWAADASIGDIAAYFGATRGKISGIMNRDRQRFPEKTKGKMARNRSGGNGSGSPAVQFEAAPAKSKPADGHTGRKIYNVHRARIEAAKREAAEFQAGTSELLKTAPSDELRRPMGKELIDLEPHDCRWPIGSASPFKFCAAKQFQGSSYCAHHMLRSMPKWRVDG